MSTPLLQFDTPSRTSFFMFHAPAARRVDVGLFFSESPAERRAARPAGNDPVIQTVRPEVRQWVNLTQIRPGLWTGKSQLVPGWHEYLFLVDGAWVMDPEASGVCAASEGGFNAVRFVPGEQVAGPFARRAFARAS